MVNLGVRAAFSNSIDSEMALNLAIVFVHHIDAECICTCKDIRDLPFHCFHFLQPGEEKLVELKYGASFLYFYR